MDPDEEVELLSADAHIHITVEVRALEVTLVHDLTYGCGLANIEATCFFNEQERPISGPGNLCRIKRMLWVPIYNGTFLFPGSRVQM
jgi:hypothetical protein